MINKIKLLVKKLDNLQEEFFIIYLKKKIVFLKITI